MTPPEGAPVLARRRRLLRSIIVVYLLLGGLGLAGSLLLAEEPAGLAYLLVSVLPVLAIPIGVALLRPRSVWPWLLLAAGQGAFFVGDIVWHLDPAAETTFPGLADIPYLAGYPLLAAGLLYFVRLRRPRYRLVPSIDAFAVAVAYTMVLWLVLIARFINDPGLTLADKAALSAYPLGDVVLLAAATYMLLAAGGYRIRAQQLLMVALLALFAADVLYTDQLLDGGYRGGWVDGLWLGSYLLFGLAALVPSMRTMSEAMPERRESHPGWRLLVPFTAFAVVPVFGALQHLVHGRVDVDFVIAAEITLAGLLLLRMYDIARSALAEQQRNAALLSRGYGVPARFTGWPDHP
jgi:hypothetical protein